MSPTMHHFAKRADDEFIMPKPVIVILIMFASGCATCLGYAVHKLIGFREDGNGFKPMSVAQMEYMAEVRVRNMDALAMEGRMAWGQSKRREGETTY